MRNDGSHKAPSSYSWNSSDGAVFSLTVQGGKLGFAGVDVTSPEDGMRLAHFTEYPEDGGDLTTVRDVLHLMRAPMEAFELITVWEAENDRLRREAAAGSKV